MIVRRKTLNDDIMNLKDKMKDVRSRLSSLQCQLKETEEQLEKWFVREHKRIMFSKWETEFATGAVEGVDKVPNAFGQERKSGSLGHIVQTSREFRYYGEATYKEDLESKAFSSGPTPAPTKEQYEKYGILHSYCSLNNAINASNNGDRIYLSPGIHKWEHTLDYRRKPKKPLTNDIDIIGLGDPGDVIIEIDYSEQRGCFMVQSRTCGFYNLTFKVTYDRETSTVNRTAYYGSGNDAIVTFEKGGGTHIIKNCHFRMGVSVLHAYPTRISGVFIADTKSATIDSCKFVGGSGKSVCIHE